MKHQHKGRKLKREINQRRALLKGLAVNLIARGKIKTTQARAKELRPFIERLITYAKKQNQAGYRNVGALIPKEASKKLYQEIAPRFSDRRGGYTRIIKTTKRKGDAASLAFIEFV